MKTPPLSLLCFLSLSTICASPDVLILRDFIKEDHYVLLSAPSEAVKESMANDLITEVQAKEIAIKALESWYAHLPASISEPTVRKQSYRYVHTHPIEQKELVASYYWCSSMIGFGETPTTFYEIDFLILQDGVVFKSEREYRPEFLHYDVNFRNGVPVGSEEK